jgi:hypothetical protein
MLDIDNIDLFVATLPDDDDETEIETQEKPDKI